MRCSRNPVQLPAVRLRRRCLTATRRRHSRLDRDLHARRLVERSRRDNHRARRPARHRYKYNQELGMGRANAAKDYLTAHGVTGSAVTVRSRGDQDATGTDASSWQLDRRVDIEESVAMAHRRESERRGHSYAA
ncbi:MAG TPA: OmpA family protein [Polyangiales bacterium]|nr:OmpA family protein [Polyangiales bacterium]